MIPNGFASNCNQHQILKTNFEKQGKCSLAQTIIRNQNLATVIY